MTLIAKRSAADDDVDADECVAILSSASPPLLRRRSLFVPVAAASTSSFVGIAITITTSLAYATVATITKYINTTYNVPLLQSLVLLVGFQALPAIVGLYMQQHGSISPLWSDSLWRHHGWRLIGRGICGVLVNLLQLTAMTQMPIGNASVVFWTCPVFVALISLLFLGERLTPVKIACICACLGGCALVTKSEALFGVTSGVVAHTSEHPLAFLYALSAALLQATALVVLRALRHVNPFVIITYYGLVGGIVSAVWAGIGATEQLIIPFNASPGAVAWPMLLLLAAGMNAAANVAQSYACQRENANVVGLVSSLELVFTYGWQIVLFKEIPSWLSVVGALLVLGSVVLLGIEKGIVAKAVSTTTTTTFPTQDRISDDDSKQYA